MKEDEVPFVEVKFVTDESPWEAGDVCVFPPGVAEKLVRHGVAVYTKKG